MAPRIPRKKGQPAGSKKHSDLYTDENPKDTVRIKFATPTDARKTVSKKITKAKRMIRSSDDNLELIKKLGELKKAGVISSKEFQTKKKQLLDKI